MASRPVLVPYTESHRRAYASFRDRLGDRFPYDCTEPFAYYTNKALFVGQLWLLVQNSDVLGAVYTKDQEYRIDGQRRRVAFIKYPITSGIIDARYAYAPIFLISEIRRKFEYSFLLGMGGRHSRTAIIFEKFGYQVFDIPFLVKPINVGGLLLNNSVVESRAPWLASRKISGPGLCRNRISVGLREVSRFRAGDLQGRNDEGSFSLIRNSQLLNSQVPDGLKCFRKLTIEHPDGEKAYISLLVSQCQHHKYFGNLKIGVLLDLALCKARGNWRETLTALHRYARNQGVDVLMCNTGKGEHLGLLKKSGWFSLTSNFAIAASPMLAKCIDPIDMHITRLDGDGPIGFGVDL